MKFYLNNRIDAEFDTDIDELAQKFWASRQGRQQLNPTFEFPLERSLRGWLTDPEGYNSSWEDESEETGFGALFSKVREIWPKCRYAKVHASSGTVAAYLPRGYWITKEWADSPSWVLIQGIDNAGWTLEDYVIPRLASGLIHAEEITEAQAAELGGS